MPLVAFEMDSDFFLKTAIKYDMLNHIDTISQENTIFKILVVSGKLGPSTVRNCTGGLIAS